MRIGIFNELVVRLKTWLFLPIWLREPAATNWIETRTLNNESAGNNE